MSICNDYTDSMPIPFGKYKGTSLGNVPANYLLWLYETSEQGERLSDRKLANYIKDNLKGLQIERESEKQRNRYEKQ